MNETEIRDLETKITGAREQLIGLEARESALTTEHQSATEKAILAGSSLPVEPKELLTLSARKRALFGAITGLQAKLSTGREKLRAAQKAADRQKLKDNISALEKELADRRIGLRKLFLEMSRELCSLYGAALTQELLFHVNIPGSPSITARPILGDYGVWAEIETEIKAVPLDQKILDARHMLEVLGER